MKNIINNLEKKIADLGIKIYKKRLEHVLILNTHLINLKSNPSLPAIEINITFIFEDKEANEKKAYFEITYAVITKINDDIKDKKELEKIILCDVPNSVYPDIEKTFLSLVHNSGYPALKFEKQVDFNKLFNERSN